MEDIDVKTSSEENKQRLKEYQKNYRRTKINNKNKIFLSFFIYIV